MVGTSLIEGMSESVGEIVGAVITYCVVPLRFCAVVMKIAINKHRTTEATPQNTAAIPLFVTVEFILTMLTSKLLRPDE